MKYFIIFMKWVFSKLGLLGGLFFKLGRFLPVSLAGVFLVSQFFIDLFGAGFNTAAFGLVTSVFAAEKTINTNVLMAVHTPEMYGIKEFIAIVISIFIMYSLIKFLYNVQVNVGGEQSKGMAVIFAVIVFGIISVAGIAIVDKTLGFIPIYHSLYLLFTNFQPVIFSIFGKAAVTVIADNVTNSTLLDVANSTLLNSSIT